MEGRNRRITELAGISCPTGTRQSDREEHSGASVHTQKDAQLHTYHTHTEAHLHTHIHDKLILMCFFQKIRSLFEEYSCFACMYVLHTAGSHGSQRGHQTSGT